MLNYPLELRDYEILRTLVRVRFLRYAQLSANFFFTAQNARRRIQKLQGRGFIERHTKGAPPGTNYCAWRITRQGIMALGREAPDEPVSEDLADRLERQSLVENHHREELANLYLALVVGEERPSANDNDGVRKWAAELRARAEQIDWYPDGEVILQFFEQGEERRVIPDATAAPRGKRQRFFIEMDRSTKSLKTIRETMQKYARFAQIGGYTKAYPDGKAPWVVYVVPTEARRANIKRIAEKVLEGSGLRWKVLVLSKDALHWLDEALFTEPVGSAPADVAMNPDLALLVEAHLRASEVLLREVSAVVEEAEQMHPEAVAPWKRSLAALYAAMRPKLEVSHAR